MINNKYLDILNDGVAAWNSWRKDNFNEEVVLRQVDISKLTLCGADFRNVDLSGSILAFADLAESNLSGAIIRNANLSMTNLNGAIIVKADLGGSNLDGSNISRAILVGSRLIGTYLRRVNLSEAKLYQTHLETVDLSGSNLSLASLVNAYINNVNFSQVNLWRADLSSSNITASNFFRTNLCETDFIGTNLIMTCFNESYADESNFLNCTMDNNIFSAVDLSNVKNLDTVKHLGPSSIGIDTLIISRGKLPEVFLQGVGLSDEIINYQNRLFRKQPKFYSCFISYSNTDKAFAERLYADLQSVGIRCWYAPEEMKIGDTFRDVIDRTIRDYDKVLIILSQDALDSAWVKKEAETAFEEERRRNGDVLFPIRLDDVVLSTDKAWASDIRRMKHIGDFTEWTNPILYKKSLKKLVGDLKTL